MSSDKQLPLEKTSPKLEQPAHLRRICSVGTGRTNARDFFEMLGREKVTAVIDTRKVRNYSRAGFSEGGNLEYVCELLDIAYVVCESLMPSAEMRTVFADTFTDVKSASKRDPEAWTKYLQQYERLMRERRPLTMDEILRATLYGRHEVVAVLCACPHHDDCHRSYTVGMLERYIEGVTASVVYPTSKPPSFASPRRYRLADLPLAGLVTNGPRRRGTS